MIRGIDYMTFGEKTILWLQNSIDILENYEFVISKKMHAGVDSEKGSISI